MRILLAFVAFSLIGCDKVEEPSQPSDVSRSTRSSKISTLAFDGLTLGYEASGFDLGTRTGANETDALVRVVGTVGTYAFDKVTGSSLGVRRAGAEYQPWLRTREEHEAAVRDFFIARGLSRDQVQGTHSLHVTSGGGRTADERKELTHVFLTSIDRQIDGFLVAESVAGAELSEDGKVVREQLNWPAIPEAVVADARALRAAVSAHRASLFDALPADARGGEVRIHHGLVLAQKLVPAIATYDVQSGTGSAEQSRSFTIAGEEVQIDSVASELGTARSQP